jgi:hypothetical protein
VDAVVEVVVDCAIPDTFLEPAVYKSDTPHASKDRFHRAITQRRRLIKASPIADASFLTLVTAQSIAKLFADDGPEKEEIRTLQSVISQRLEWTSRELTG